MTLHAILDLLAMLVCSVYGTIPLFWLVVHPFIDRWRKRGRRAYALILPVWGFFIAVTFLILWPFRFEHLYRTWFAWVPAVTSVLHRLLRLFRSVPKLRSRASLRPGRTGTDSASSGTCHYRDSLARQASDLSWTSVRDSGLVHGNWTDCVVWVGGIRYRHWFGDDQN